jgi:GAF domain-containing protein
MDMINKLAEQAGIAVVNARLYKDIKDDYESLKKELPPNLANHLSEKSK